MKGKSLSLVFGLNLLLPGAGYLYMGKWIVGIFACLIVVSIYASAGLQFLMPAWIGMNFIMAIDMTLLAGKNKEKIAEAVTMKCPNCAETIPQVTRVYQFCNTRLVSKLRLSNQSAGSLAWFSVLLLVPGIAIMSPASRITCIELAALIALIPVIFGSMKWRIFGGIVFVVCIAIGIPTYSEYKEELDQYMELAKQREKTPQPLLPGNPDPAKAPG